MCERRENVMQKLADCELKFNAFFVVICIQSICARFVLFSLFKLFGFVVVKMFVLVAVLPTFNSFLKNLKTFQS